MKVLAIDTATELCGVALSQDGNLLAEYRLNLKTVHNEKLVTLIQTLLNDVGWLIEMVSVIGVSIGPGSFTGLRIGLSAAKGLAFSLQKPIVAVNTLDVLASGIPYWDGEIATVLPARDGEIYLATYRQGEKLQLQSGYQIIPVAEFDAAIKPNTLVAAAPATLLRQLSAGNMIAAAPHLCLSQPSTVARLAAAKFEMGEVEDVARLEPFYLKEFEPKTKKYYVD